MPNTLTPDQVDSIRRSMNRMSVRDMMRGGLTDLINNARNRNAMANQEGTGLLQTREPFDDIRGMLDPQRALSLQQYSQGFDEQYRGLSQTFDQLRGRRGGAFQSGFIDYAHQEARRAIDRRRQGALHDMQTRFSEQTLSMQAANEETRLQNDRSYFEVHGDDAYDYIRNRRRNY